MMRGATSDAARLRRSLYCLGAALLFAACASDGGPGTESPIVGGSGGLGSAGTGGVSGSAGNAGTGGVSGVAGTGNAGMGAGGSSGAGGSAGTGQTGGTGGAGGDITGDGDDAGTDDEGFCTVLCTGIAPDEGVSEACAAITSMDACELFETGAFPAGCRWVTSDSEPCLAP